MDGLVARHKDATGDTLFGVVFGNGPLPAFHQGMRYFEVRIQATRSGHNDGLTLGVTTALPASPQTPIEVADAIPNSWSIGYDGGAHVDGQASIVPVKWMSRELRVGEHAGILVTSDGSMWAVQDGRSVACLPGKVPCDRPLFPLVDLLGSASAVSLVLGAAPPAQVPFVLGDSLACTLASFNPHLAGPMVTVSPDGLTARHKEPSGDMLHGVVFGDAPLPSWHGRLFFEVRIEETCTGHEDGLTIGVTTELPSASRPPYEVAAEVPSSWSLGYFGAARVDGCTEWLPIAWNPSLLRVGDRIGLLILPGEEMQVLQNGHVAVRLSCAVPRDTPLYAFVDLLGNTSAVSLNPAGAPPPQVSWEASGAATASMPGPVGEVEGLISPQAGSLPAETTDARQDAARMSAPLPMGDQGGSQLRGSVVSVVDLSQLVVDERAQLSGFAAHLLSNSVVLSPERLLARRHDPMSGGLCGVVFSEAPIPRFKQGFYFEVRVEEICAGNTDGLTLGVTPLLPEPTQLPFEVAEMVPLSWSLGYDGAAHLHGQEEMVDIDWNPAALSVGDKVGLLVRPEGDCQLIENGVVVCQVAASVPTDVPLYAIVDLLGNTVAASLTVCAPAS